MTEGRANKSEAEATVSPPHRVQFGLGCFLPWKCLRAFELHAVQLGRIDAERL